MHRALDFFFHIVTSPSFFLTVCLLPVWFFFLFLSFFFVGITCIFFFLIKTCLLKCQSVLLFLCPWSVFFWRVCFPHFSVLVLLTRGHGIFSIYRSSTNAANSARRSMKVSAFLASILVVVSHQCLCRVCYYRSAVHGTGEWAVLWDVVSEYMYILCIYVTFCASVHSRCAFCVCWKAVFCVKNRRVHVESFKGQVNACWLCTKVGEVELSCVFVQPVLCFSLIKYSAGLHAHTQNHAHAHVN